MIVVGMRSNLKCTRNLPMVIKKGAIFWMKNVHRNQTNSALRRPKYSAAMTSWVKLYVPKLSSPTNVYWRNMFLNICVIHTKIFLKLHCMNHPECSHDVSKRNMKIKTLQVVTNHFVMTTMRYKFFWKVQYSFVKKKIK